MKRPFEFPIRVGKQLVSAAERINKGMHGTSSRRCVSLSSDLGTLARMQDSYPYEPLAAVMIHVAILAFQGRLSSACQQYVNLSIGTQLTRLENRMPEGERFDQAKFVRVLKIEGKCSCLRAKAAYISGHLPPDVSGSL